MSEWIKIEEGNVIKDGWYDIYVSDKFPNDGFKKMGGRLTDIVYRDGDFNRVSRDDEYNIEYAVVPYVTHYMLSPDDPE